MIVKVNVPLVPVDGPEKTNTGYSYTVKESYFKSFNQLLRLRWVLSVTLLSLNLKLRSVYLYESNTYTNTCWCFYQSIRHLGVTYFFNR